MPGKNLVGARRVWVLSGDSEGAWPVVRNLWLKTAASGTSLGGFALF